MAPPKNDPEYPEDFINQEVKDFMRKFYEASNHPKAHAEYANLFTHDGIVVFASSEAKGTKSQSMSYSMKLGFMRTNQLLDIHKLREEIWTNIPHREHRCVKVYPFDKEGHDLMVLGVVDYKHHDGHEKGTEWSARYKLVKENGELKVALARIFFVRNDGSNRRLVC